MNKFVNIKIGYMEFFFLSSIFFEVNVITTLYFQIILQLFF
jgi:hypothetical protein